MQDIIFYVAANETLGAVRDCSNQRNESTPVLTIGVAVRLRMRIFAERNEAKPYPVDAFSGIVSWNWSMDSDFAQETTCKLTADAGGIEVQSVNDTIDGKTVTFTEFTIPISNMNTAELNAWLGSEKSKSGMTGELTGYDGLGNAVFVIQIQDFTIRNRLTGNGSPTVMDQEYLTRNEAQSMILYAISSGGMTINASNVSSAVSAGYASSAGSIPSATNYGYGAVKVSGSVTSRTAGSDVYVPTVNAMIDYMSTYVTQGGLTTSNYVETAIGSALSAFAGSMGLGSSTTLGWVEIQNSSASSGGSSLG